jgi:hypothetical protein
MFSLLCLLVFLNIYTANNDNCGNNNIIIKPIKKLTEQFVLNDVNQIVNYTELFYDDAEKYLKSVYGTLSTQYYSKYYSNPSDICVYGNNGIGDCPSTDMSVCCSEGRCGLLSLFCSETDNWVNTEPCTLAPNELKVVAGPMYCGSNTCSLSKEYSESIQTTVSLGVSITTTFEAGFIVAKTSFAVEFTASVSVGITKTETETFTCNFGEGDTAVILQTAYILSCPTTTGHISFIRPSIHGCDPNDGQTCWWSGNVTDGYDPNTEVLKDNFGNIILFTICYKFH